MNVKASIAIELFGPADSEGRKLIYFRVAWRNKFSRYSSGSKIRLTKEQLANPRLKVTAIAMEEIEPALAAAKRIIDDLGMNFSFMVFKQRYRESCFGRQQNDDATLQTAAKVYFENRAISQKTHEVYTVAVNWMTRYAGRILLTDITAETLSGYVKFMKREHRKEDLERRRKNKEAVSVGKEMSENSVRINLRSIRAIYNYGVKKFGLHLPNPFHELEGQSTSSIPRQKAALSAEELERIILYNPRDQKEEFSKDFFLLTIAISGANIGDILSLRNGDIHGEEIWFIRRKARRGGLITKIPFTAWAKEIFLKYGCLDPNAPQREILPTLWGAKSEKQINSRIHDFDARINDGLKGVAEGLGMEPFTTIIARHSFAVFSVSNGFTVEQVQHFMGHSSPNTTKAYLRSIDTDVIRRSASALDNFRTAAMEKKNGKAGL